MDRHAFVARVMVLAMAVGTLAASSASSSPRRGPSVVVAVADTGINPYHEVYHRPSFTRHPCTWVAGYDDCNIPALHLSIGEYDTYEQAVAADLELWQSLRFGQWYWIPKTNIIGAVCSSARSAVGMAEGVIMEDLCILDEHGHGTGTTSSVLSEAPDALLLAHEGNSGAEFLETAPVTPDIQSHSWGPAAPLPLQAGDAALSSVGIRLSGPGSDRPETIFFIAAGNEAPWPTILDVSRVDLSVQVVGGAWPGYGNTSSWTAYDFASWFCRPTAAADHVSEMRASYCGTSFSAPTVAGAAAQALLEIRRAERFSGRSTETMVSGKVSRVDFIDGLRRAASYAPTSKFDNRASIYGAVPLVPGHEYLWWGYGWIDSTVVDDIVACATGRACPERSEISETWNAARREARRRQYEPLTSGVQLVQQDDAGSGRDAGASRETAVTIEPGRSYDGTLYSAVDQGDESDWFAFEVRAGQTIKIAFEGTVGCVDVMNARDVEVERRCGSGLLPSIMEVVAGSTGEWLVAYGYVASPQTYRFAVTVDGSPPTLD